MKQNEALGDMDGLFDPKEVKKAMGQAESIARDWSDSEISYLRKRCKNDLFFLCAGPLEYTKLSERLHGDLATWMFRTRGTQHRLLLLPRGHYKSTIATISESVQMALPNDAGVQEHPFYLGPNIKILLAHEVRETASKFLYEITAAFVRKPAMLALFPECIPSRKLDRMNKWELELPRNQYHKEATFSTIGTGGAAQGGHFNWLKLDDLIGEAARDSETTMATALSWFDNINSLLTEFEIDGWDLVGTRWAYSDVYSRAMRVYGINIEESVLNCIPKREIDKFAGGVLSVYARGAVENESPVFPELFSMEKLMIIRNSNIMVWSTQYANNPAASGLTEFTWPFKHYKVAENQRDILVPAPGEGTKRIPISSLEISILVDPSMGEADSADPTGIVIVGVSKDFNIFVLETIKKRLKPTAFVAEMFRLNQKWRPARICIEKVNFSGIYKYWIEEKASQMRTWLPIKPYSPGLRNKNSRIRKLGHLFSAGQIWLAEMMADLKEEYIQFPMSNDDHLLDALAQGPDFWTGSVSNADILSQSKVVDSLVEQRSAYTGY